MLIDYITTFESIAFRRCRRAPSPYRRAIGIAISMLIGANEKERSEIEKTLEGAYEMRNNLSYGHLMEVTEIEPYSYEKAEKHF
jgi:hypothetical protein